jgi:hypothetical protein
VNEKNRPAETGPAPKLTNNATAASISPTADARPLIGHTVEKALDAALWRLRTGEIGLEDLTPGLAGFCTLSHDDGFKAGVESVAIELRQALSDRDRYYQAAFSPRAPIKVGPSYADLEANRRSTYSGGAK